MQSGFNIKELFQEAQSRWLKAAEVQFILQNHESHQLAQKPPERPHSGSVFLFNKRILRFFRRDGHNWRKKKDGRTVGEAHERLKVGNIDALNCYYAHGDPNSNFQRRSYWMLDPAYEHIVLVHYREVAEGRSYVGSTSNLSFDSTFSQNPSFYSAQTTISTYGSSELYGPSNGLSPASVEEVSSKLVVVNDDMYHLNSMGRAVDSSSSSAAEVQALRRLEEQLSLNDDDNPLFYTGKLPPYPNQNAYERGGSKLEALIDLTHELEYEDHVQCLDGNLGKQDDPNSLLLLQNSGDNRKQHGQPLGPEYTLDRKGSPFWNEMLVFSSNSTGIESQEKNSPTLTLESIPQLVPQPSTSSMYNLESDYRAKDVISHESAKHLSSSERGEISVNPSDQNEYLTSQWLDYSRSNAENVTNYFPTSENDFTQRVAAAREFLLGSKNSIVSPTSIPLLQEVENPNTYSYSPETSNESYSDMVMLRKIKSIDWVDAKNIVIDDHKYSPNYYGTLFDKESHLGTPFEVNSSLTVAQNQRFSIREVSPEWAYTTEDAKVIITGDFLCDPSECAWACMFGETEVPLEIIQPGVFRCHAPQHVASKVTLCITCGNRESCSEVRDFEYRIKPSSCSIHCNLPQADAAKNKEEMWMLVRFAQMLLYGHDKASIQREDTVESEIDPSRKLKIADDPWAQIIQADLVVGETTMDWLLQDFLKDKLQQWLSSKYQDAEITGCSLSKQEQGMIHMIAGLGYEWALNSILSVGVGINFRDVYGWTALHWAARFGREKMVAALLAVGALPGAVTDPTPQDPVGKTPASIAAANGHKGLAGYLSEMALTTHLNSLKLEVSEIHKGSAAVEAEKTVEKISEGSMQLPIGATEDHLSLKDSLAAVRNAAQAAARIQSAFRAHSFRRRQHIAATSYDEYGMTLDDIHGLSAASKLQRGSSSFHDHKAALSIQKKYRGWKGRKEFLTLRQNVVKIQAHVRGHQVRKKYEFTWTVSVLEKVILRWRRRGVGLRGFKAESECIDESEADDILKVFRKQKVDAAVDEAVLTVLSMVDSPVARQQYRRMLERYRQAKAMFSSGNASETTSSSHGTASNMENDDNDYMYRFT